MADVRDDPLMEWLRENVSWVIPMVVGLVVTWVVTRQYSARRSRVTIAWETVALLNDRASSTDLQVLHEGRPVVEPHLVTIKIRCHRPRDITRDDFHDGNPWQITFAEATPLSVAGDDIGATADSTEKLVRIPPRHLPAGTEHHLTVVTMRRAKSLSISALVNTDSRIRYGIRQASGRAMWVGTPIALGIGLALGMWVLPDLLPETGTTIVLSVSGILALGGALLGALHVRYLR